MAGRGEIAGRKTAGWLLVLLLPWAVAPLAAAKGPRATAQPLYSLPVGQLGYQPQNAFDLTGRSSTNSLDFIDQDHLLLTFRSGGLLRRASDAQIDDDDQMIHAVVLELPSGKVTATADWRMHDRGRYLWALQDGTFLVRQRDTLWLTDAGLSLRPFMQLPTRLQAVQPSPDGKLLLLEVDQERHTPEDHERLVKEARAAGASMPREDVQLLILRRKTGEVIARSHSMRPVNMPMLADGFFESIPSKADKWQLRYVTFGGEPQVFGEIASTCTPSEAAATADVSLLITCDSKSEDRLVQGVRRDGKILWDFWWDHLLIWPLFSSSADGSRFVFSALRSDHAISALDPVDPEDLRGQTTQVFDAASGALLLTVSSSPVTSCGQNYALSPEGRRFAFLRAQAIDVYDVPAAVPPAAPSNKK